MYQLWNTVYLDFLRWLNYFENFTLLWPCLQEIHCTNKLSQQVVNAKWNKQDILLTSRILLRPAISTSIKSIFKVVSNRPGFRNVIRKKNSFLSFNFSSSIFKPEESQLSILSDVIHSIHNPLKTTFSNQMHD